MKKLQTIANEFSEIVDIQSSYISDDIVWNFYRSITYFLDDNYNRITFKNHTINNKDEIEICAQSETPMLIIDIIKKIEPLCVITYYEKTVTFTEKTI